MHIDSTEGNVSVADRDEKVALNVYRKKPWWTGFRGFYGSFASLG